MTIWMVKGASVQKLLPASTASAEGLSPVAVPARKTTTTPASAKTSGSGNQRSLHSARARPRRTSGPWVSEVVGGPMWGSMASRASIVNDLNISRRWTQMDADKKRIFVFNDFLGSFGKLPRGGVG